EADINNDGKPVRLRLLQVDVAIKDKESKEHSGWIFGTFVFDASQKKSNYWENLVPVGLEWGNSPKLTYTEFSKGLSAYEGWVNPYMKRLFGSRPPDGLMGYLGRMNGPVDSPLSSCMSCHSRALDSNGKNAPAFNPPESSMCIARVQTENNNETYRRISNCVVDENTVKPFYRNLKSNEPFVPGFNSVDYSLQLALGIANWHAWYKSKFPNEYELIFPTKKPDNSLNLKMFGLNAKKSTNIPMMPAQEAFHRGD
ncbi:MAG: hypothetical protein KKF58_01355, partial [Gammaproteobacteria bacterium]|nr:hypothetical protein [Gammaproteobacteria bacterium]MBU1446934.1 hypothetical protein [Gammaproteobacteria bacterium]